MIINCPNCKKKFKIDDNLIPLEGRDLQCGSCSQIWFYEKKKIPSETHNFNKNISDTMIESSNTIEVNDMEIELGESKLNQDLEEKITKNIDKKDKIKNIDLSKKSKNITFSNFLSYLIVSIISFIAVVILLDTFRIPLIDIFPGLEKLLFNLFETLKDIKLFFIDLF